MDGKDRAEKTVEEAEEALRESRREAASRKVEDQGTEGGLTEATHGHNPHTPERAGGRGTTV